jgi:peptide/nickel transport system permease protein/glutathione transport system permease protein
MAAGTGAGACARRKAAFMIRYLFTRLAVALPTLLAVLTLVFVLVRIVPGDPAFVVLGDQATPEALAELRARMGLDQPLWAQYLHFMAGVFTGDFGRSLVTNRPVMTDVLAVLPFTIELTVASLAIGVIFGVPLGVWAGRHRDRTPDWVARIVSLAGLSFPAFVSGVLMLIAFAVELNWFPVISRGVPLTEPVERLRSLALPALNLGLIMTAYVTRVTRSGMITALSEDYVRTARAKGMPARVVIWRHAFRNVLIPIVTVIGLYTGVLIGNSVLTEIVFNRPGLGKLIVGALEKRDYAMLQGLMVSYAFFIVVVNVLTDLAYGFVDPRVKAS